MIKNLTLPQLRSAREPQRITETDYLRIYCRGNTVFYNNWELLKKTDSEKNHQRNYLERNGLKIEISFVKGMAWKLV